MIHRTVADPGFHPPSSTEKESVGSGLGRRRRKTLVEYVFRISMAVMQDPSVRFESAFPFLLSSLDSSSTTLMRPFATAYALELTHYFLVMGDDD